MSEIKRYDLSQSGMYKEHGFHMSTDATGEYVLHSDHLAATAKLEERVRVLEEAMKDVTMIRFCGGTIYDAEAIATKALRPQSRKDKNEIS
jgi:hypothetical protein